MRGMTQIKIFGYALGFTREDLYKKLDGGTELHPNSFGMCHANINPSSCLQIFSPGADNYSPTPDFLNLKILSQILEDNSNGSGLLNSVLWGYDGSTVGINASKQCILNPLPYARCVISDIAPGTNSGTQGPQRGVLGFSQALSLVNQTNGGVLSFAVFNPLTITIGGDCVINSLTVRIEDPRNGGKLLDWISDQPISTVFLRIINP